MSGAVPYLAGSAICAKDPQEAVRLRTQARVLLNELASRRRDWSVIPLALAQLEQQELLYQDKLTDEEIQAKEESIIHSYRRAIELGERSSAVVRDAVRLLFKNKRGSEALDLLNSVPLESQLTGALGRQVSSFAVDSRDFLRAKEIARKMVDLNPGDFQERIWLVQILLSSGRQAEAETEILQAVELSKADPDRWITLVQFMVITKQLEKAEKAVRGAEVVLPPNQAPLAMAQCCQLMGRAYEQIDKEATKQWYARAAGWYEKAKAAHPDDFSIVRRLTIFYLQTKQVAEAEAQLNAILKEGANSQSAERVAWARRTLALALSTDRQRVHDALALLKNVGSQTTTDKQGAVAAEDPEDLRVLARVLDAQKTVAERKRAIEILESLIAKNLANADDRFLLARLYESSGDWPRARVAYRELNLRTKSSRDMETLDHRPLYLGEFVRSLLRNHKAKDDQDLIEAEDLVEELKQLQPDQLGTLVLQVEIAHARNQPEKALDLIQTTAQRLDLAPQAIKKLAELAENLGRLELAKQLYSRYASVPGIRDGKIIMAKFLGRQGQINDALDLCESLWADPRNAEMAAGACINLILSTNARPNSPELGRVANWLEQAVKQKTDSPLLLVGLGNCRERQERYKDAKALYERVIRQGSQTAGSTNPNDFIAASYNNLAWLLAFEDKQGKNALVDIDNAIKLAGPLPDYLDTRGVVYLGLNQTQNAIKDLEMAVEGDPSPAKLFHLAQAYLQANDKEKAKYYWKDVREKKLDQISYGPGSLHPLEQSAYQKVLTELGSP